MNYLTPFQTQKNHETVNSGRVQVNKIFYVGSYIVKFLKRIKFRQK